jgi:hypothetical protein
MIVTLSLLYAVPLAGFDRLDRRQENNPCDQTYGERRSLTSGATA